ncbi:arylesterase precursor [Sulfuriferula multivorans]|uniref:Arylesterase n=1 Tax=Sulfuriferula multivorans TaxID=1559896 RepID=A0A401JBM9_9PROT|nr:arylesterase [Sulfuriferula multivorans]GBL45053.1 arylesterase precursor [Sulfuriferula multivorans]
MNFRKILLLLCLVVSGAAQAAPVILVFGDSLSAGYGLETSQAWPSLLQQRLNHNKQNWRVVNASISGETSAGGLARLPAALVQQKPAIVILELGANDGLRGLSLTAMQHNLDAMILLIQHTGARVLLVGIHLPPNYGMAYTEKFLHTYETLAQQRHVALLPSLLSGIETKRELFQADGFHPIASAQNQVLDNVWKSLQPLLTARRLR